MRTQAKRQDGRSSRFSKDGGLWTLRDTLAETFETVVGAARELDRTFVGFAQYVSRSKEMSTVSRHEEHVLNLDHDLQIAARLWAAFKHGYMAWHLNCGRYNLKSLKACYDSELDSPK
jgi:hypothetical protein